MTFTMLALCGALRAFASLARSFCRRARRVSARFAPRQVAGFIRLFPLQAQEAALPVGALLLYGQHKGASSSLLRRILVHNLDKMQLRVPQR
jgi:hypothetical protein